MAESVALLVDEVFPQRSARQLVLRAPYSLRFRFASRLEVIGRVLGFVYRCIAIHLIKKAGFSRKTAQACVFTLIQRLGSALNVNIHFHMLFLDWVYIKHPKARCTSVRCRHRPEPSLPDSPRSWRSVSVDTWNARDC
jgi:hypothetical protein